MNYFQYKELLSPPIKRAAYSDRTAWVMAVMSNLAYIKCETGEDQKEELKDALTEAGFELIEVFSKDGTQAFLAKRESDKFLALAFRGTEKDKFGDIVADLDARFYKNEQGIKIHNGFYQAFSCVKEIISIELAKFKEYSLYITGHSLGGALALVATREFNSDNLAACYTFGSPRVGSSEFGDDIKPPIYRIVNALDPVPCLPFIYLYTFLYSVGKFLEKKFRISWLRKYVEKNKNYYAHHGDMRFLTVCGTDYKNVRLIYSYDETWRLIRLLVAIIKHRRVSVSDHAIHEYCKKLGEYGLKRI